MLAGNRMHPLLVAMLEQQQFDRTQQDLSQSGYPMMANSYFGVRNAMPFKPGILTRGGSQFLSDMRQPPGNPARYLR